MFKIPVSNSLYGAVNFPLEGSIYRFVYRYNSRNENWLLDIFAGEDEDDIVLRTLKINVDGSIYSNYSDERLPSGRMFLVQNNPNSRLTTDNLGIGKEFEIVYLSPTELG